MTASFRKINYSLRPAKHAERKMMCDIYRRLEHFSPVEDIPYVGFGSIWFSDFITFHKALGIKSMLSIEMSGQGNKEIQDRFNYNKPYWIDIDYRQSINVLPELDYTKPQFIWLDYDKYIDKDMILDARTVASRACSGTVLALSIACHEDPSVSQAAQDKEVDPNAQQAIDLFSTRVGLNRVPIGTKSTQLRGWKLGGLSRNIFKSEIENALHQLYRDAAQKKISMKTICEIEYSDDAKMTTLIVCFVSSEHEAKYSACNMGNLDFLNHDGKPVRIEFPKLTPKEFRHLDAQLPSNNGREIEFGTIPKKDGKIYSKFYRYFPNFAAVEH